MRFLSAALGAALSTTAIAQTNLVGSLPTCAQSCVGTSYGGCAPLNISCICNNKDYISSLSCCIASVCNAADQAATISFAVNLCKTNGVTVPSSVSCSSSAVSTASAPTSSVSGASSTGTANMTLSLMSPSITSVTGLSGTRSATGRATGSASSLAAQGSGAAAPLHSPGAGFGLGVAVAGLLAVL